MIVNHCPSVFKYVTMQGGKASLLNRTIQFTHPKDLNDPFDCLPARPRDKEVAERLRKDYPNCIVKDVDVKRNLDQRSPNHYLNIREQLSIALSSFSGLWDCMLMWAHYTDSFKGCCLEFCAEKLLNDLNIKEFFFVDYGVERIPMPTDSDACNYTSAIQQLLRQKHQYWSYECEQRLFLSTEHDRGGGYLALEREVVSTFFARHLVVCNCGNKSFRTRRYGYNNTMQKILFSYSCLSRLSRR